MFKENMAEIATMLSATSGIAIKSMFISVDLEDLMLYWVFPITAGSIVHVFRRLTDKYLFRNENKEQEKEKEND